MHRSKWICLSCLKSGKGDGTCGCKNPKISGCSNKVRAVKITASKTKKKAFLKYLYQWTYVREQAKLFGIKVPS